MNQEKRTCLVEVFMDKQTQPRGKTVGKRPFSKSLQNAVKCEK